MTESNAREGAPQVRKRPAQQRSRERMEAILEAATVLIAEKGSDPMRMSDVAARAGVSIGSLYQYFPEKGALIRTLAERYNAASRECIAAALEDVESVEALTAAYSGLVDQYYEIVMAEPVMRDIWSGMQADRLLMAHQLAESRHCGAILAAAMRRVHPGRDPEQIAETAFLIWEMGEAVVRLAISVESDEGRGLIEAFKRMTVREVGLATASAG